MDYSEKENSFTFSDPLKEDKEIIGKIGKVVLKENPDLSPRTDKVKEAVNQERHAYHRQRLHQ